MSKRESDDLDTPGCFLPEGWQLRLAKLRDRIQLLVRLAQPRMSGEEREWASEGRMSELALCLESLAEQADLLLGELSGVPPQRVAANTAGRDATPAPPQEGSETVGGRLVFGVTMHQVDTLDRLVQMISAHGDVVAAGHAAELADHTLPLMGQAVRDAAVAVRAILEQVEAQGFGQGTRPRSGVGEARGAYVAGPRPLEKSGGPDLPRSTHTTQASRPRRIRRVRYRAGDGDASLPGSSSRTAGTVLGSLPLHHAGGAASHTRIKGG